MTKRNLVLIFTALVLAGVYVFYFTDWFKPKAIHITHTSRIIRYRRYIAADSTTIPITFILERPYKLTEIKVVALDEWQANKDCLPLWHLIADTNSVPITEPFFYGQRIRGMKSEVPGANAQPLQPGVTYRLFVTDGRAKGEHDFQPVANPGATPATNP
jgi:hypothetical protein